MTASNPIDRITVSKVSKRYGRHRALAKVDVDIRGGAVCAVLGENGAGKSTLLGILSSLVRASAGAVHYHSGAAELELGPALRREIGVVAHESFIYHQLTALENLAFFARLYGVADASARSEAVLDEVGLERRAWTREAGTYSRGMRQRLSLARMLLPRPSVVLLDEPFTGLDQIGIDQLRALLDRFRDEGRVVAAVTHDLSAIGGKCSHVVMLRRGKVVIDDAIEGTFSSSDLADLYRAHAVRKAS